jgi:hypothetical protein
MKAMRTPLAALLFLSFALPPADALPPRKVLVEEDETPAAAQPAAPAKRGSFLNRLFGPRPTPTPAPTPTPTPAPVRRPKRKAPAANVVAPGEKAAKPAVAAPTTKPKTPAPAPKRDLSGMDDAAKFKAVKAEAAADPKIKELKAKADGALDATEADEALTAYNRALFRKIREIEPSVSGYAEKVESSLTKRLSAEKAKK